MAGSKDLSLVCASSIWAYYIIWLSRILLKLISQKMDHGKLNPLCTLFYSLSGGRSSSRWGRGHSTKGLVELRLPLVQDWRDPGVYLVWCSLTFCLCWNEALLLEIPQQYPRSRAQESESILRAVIKSPQLPGRDAAEALMKQLQAGEGWVPIPGTDCFLTPLETDSEAQRSGRGDIYFPSSVKIGLRGVQDTQVRVRTIKGPRMR